MMRRSGLLFGLVAVVAAGVVLTFWFSGRRDGMAHAQPVEPMLPNKPVPRVLLQELIPGRKTAEAEIFGGRDTTAIGSEYFVRIRTEKLGSFRLTADSAASLVKFYQRCKEVRPPRVREIEAVALTWACEPYHPVGFRATQSEGVHYEVSRLVGDEDRFFFWVWYANDESASVVFTGVFFSALADSLRELDKLRAIKPTVTP